MQQFFLGFHVLNSFKPRYSFARINTKVSLILFGLLANVLCFSVSAKGISIDGIVHPESAFTTRDGRIFISEIGLVGKEGDGTTLICGDKQMQVKWQDNRSVLFMNVDNERRLKKDRKDELNSWHRYDNKRNVANSY